MKHDKSASEILLDIAQNEKMHGFLTLKTVINLLGKRTFGLALLFFSLPSALPFSAIPGISFIFSLPIALFSLQLMFGRKNFWLPGFIANKKINHQTVVKTINKALPFLKKIERMVHPRLSFMSLPIMDRITGLIIFCMSLLLMLPIPLSNSIIGSIFIILSLGLIDKDGVFILIGYVTSILYFSFIIYVIFTSLKFFK